MLYENKYNVFYLCLASRLNASGIACIDDRIRCNLLSNFKTSY